MIVVISKFSYIFYYFMRHLTDQNECATNVHGCQHYCYNNQGKYSCGCKSGFVLNPKDGKTCLGKHLFMLWQT